MAIQQIDVTVKRRWWLAIAIGWYLVVMQRVPSDAALSWMVKHGVRIDARVKRAVLHA